MPTWKGVIGRHLDDLVNEVVPDVRKAVQLRDWIRQAADLPGDDTF